VRYEIAYLPTVCGSPARDNMQRENGLQVMTNNRSLGGDPAPGADKVLIVIYRVQGHETAAAVREGNTLTIP
jgi:hypothetical protein